MMETTEFNFAPFAYSQYSVSKKSIVVLILLFVQCFVLFFVKDYQAILRIFTCNCAIVLTAFLLGILDNNKNWFYLNLIIEATVIGLCIPNNYNIVFLFCIVSLCFFIVKGMFAGYGGNIISVVAFTVAVLYISLPGMFPETITLPALKTHGNLLSALQIKGLIQNDKSITSYLNYFFTNLGVVIPEGYIHMLYSHISSIPAFRYNLLTLISSAILFAFDYGESIISFISMVVYGGLVFIFSMVQVDGTYFTGDVITAFCTTGVLFYAFFVAGEYCTVPNTKLGKIVYAVLLGFFMFITCGAGTSPVGIAFAIIISNIFTPVILAIEKNYQSRFLRKKYGSDR